MVSGVMMVALAGAAGSETLVRRGCELAAERGCRLILAHVVDRNFLRQLPGAFHAPESTVDGLENIAELLLERYGEQAHSVGLDPTLIIRRGKLIDEINELIEENEVTTLLVSIHKKRFLEIHHSPDWDLLQTKAGIEIVVVDTRT